MAGRKGKPRKQRIKAPSCDYSDPQGNLLSLRGSLSAATRARYTDTLSGRAGSPASTVDDRWQRAVELLFEHLAVRWVISEVPLERQRELLARFRMASSAERAWVRQALREHCAAHFPELPAP